MGVQDTPTGVLPKPVPRFRHPVPFRTAALCLDGSGLVGLDSEGTLVGWDARTGRLRYRTPVLRSLDVPQRLTCSPDGRFVALSRRDHVPALIRVFRLDSGEEVRRFDRGFSPCFSPDGEVLAATDGPRLRRWATKSGAELPGLPESGEDLKWAAWSPKGDRVAASWGASSWVSVWELSTRRRTDVTGGEGVLTPATSVAFSAGGRILAVGNGWGVRFADLNGGPGLSGRNQEDYAGGPLRYSADGRTLCAVHQRRRVLCWDVVSGELLHHWSAFNIAEGVLEISESADRVIWIDADGLRVERIPRPLGGEAEEHVVVNAVFTAEGQALTVDKRGAVRVWDPAAQKEVRRFQVPSASFRNFAHNGRWAIYGGGTEPVRVWDLTAGKELASVSTTPSVTAIALSPDRESLALGHEDGALSIWTLGKTERVRIHCELAGVTAVCWSADGKSLAWGDERGTVVLAEGASGREATRFKARIPWAIRDLQFEVDGKMLVTENDGGICYAYDGTVGKDPTRLKDGAIAAFRATPLDRRWFASGFRQTVHGRAIYSGDGRYAITLSNGFARIWEAPGDP